MPWRDISFLIEETALTGCVLGGAKGVQSLDCIKMAVTMNVKYAVIRTPKILYFQ